MLHFRPVLCCILRGGDIILERTKQASPTVPDQTPELKMLLYTLLLLTYSSHYELHPAEQDNALWIISRCLHGVDVYIYKST